MTTRRGLLGSAIGWALAPGIARAATFHGFDPEHVGGEGPSVEALRAMVADATKRTKPRSGRGYVFGYTMWGGSSPFSQLNRQGLQEVADQAGITLLVADNEWDPQKNIANAQSFATRNVDAVINSLLDVQFGQAVRKPLADAGIPIVSLDIPIEGEAWVGVDNARAGFRAGTYLAQTALSRWGAGTVGGAHLVIAAFPLVGPNGKLRNLSQEAAVRSAIPALPADRVTWLDMQGTAESGYQTMTDLAGRLDPAAPVLVASFSDEQLAGALRALSVAGFGDKVLAVGMGGERLDALATDPSFIGTMSFFPRLYARAAVPTALAVLAGAALPRSVFAYSDLVTPATVCRVDPATPCRTPPAWQPARDTVDEPAYRGYVRSLHTRPEFKDFQILLPPVPSD